MVIHHIGEVVSRQPVAFDENLIVQNLVGDGDFAKNGIREGGFAGFIDFLSNDEWLAGG